MSAGTRPVSVLMVGTGRQAGRYLRALLDDVPPDRARLAGVVEPDAARAAAWTEASLGVPADASIEDYYGRGHDADLAVIATPVHYHAPQAVTALAHGSHVLCLAPLAATVQGTAALAAARNASGRSVVVAYPWSFSAAIQNLKHDILAGLFGRPKRFSALCCSPRDEASYRKHSWSGRLREAGAGRWVLDSPANDAMAHSLHNLLYLAGPARAASARPRHVQAELYRAFEIESCDTVLSRIVTEDQLEVLFFASHATRLAMEPCFRLEFDEATVTFGDESRTIVAVDALGRHKEYGSPDDTPACWALEEAIGQVRGEASVVCGIEAAEPQTLAVNGIHESMPEAVSFPAALVERDLGRGRRYVRGLDEVLRRCYALGALASESGLEWAVPGSAVCLDGYRWFPGGQVAAAPGAAR